MVNLAARSNKKKEQNHRGCMANDEDENDGGNAL